MSGRTLDPVDVYVGERLRTARLMRGLTQARLGKLSGVTFQQIQKYENGTNRMSVSRLVQLAEILDVSLSKFFEKFLIGTGKEKTQKKVFIDTDIMNRRETHELLRAYYGITDDGERRFMRQIMTLLATANN